MNIRAIAQAFSHYLLIERTFTLLRLRLALAKNPVNTCL